MISSLHIMYPNQSIANAINRIKKLKRKIILVTNKKKLVGTITDGDLRKSFFLTKKYKLLKDIMNKNPKVIIDGKKNFNLRDFFKVKYIPILNKKKEITKLKNLTKSKNFYFENNIIIFAGGFGKRLKDFTKKIPKPMLIIGKKPNLQNLLDQILKCKFRNIFISLFYKNNYIKKHLRYNHKINFYTEKKPLGTCGSLAKINFTNNLPVVALNSDLVTDLDLKNLVFFHNVNNSDLTVSVKDRSFQIPFATVKIKNNRIIGLNEKPKELHFFNAGIYVLNQKIIKLIKSGEKIDMPDLIKRALKKGFKVIPFYHHEKWVDYGTVNEYLKLKNENK